MTAGIREFKNHLSRYIRMIEAGERVEITVHGRIVAELVPASSPGDSKPSNIERLIAAGVISVPTESGDPLDHPSQIRLPRGTAASLIDDDREEA
jgi:prevent-host-death family protein